MHTQPRCALIRFDAAPQPITSAVSIYYDGSVLVVPGGIEMGQGLHTKIKQVQQFLFYCGTNLVRAVLS